MKSVLTVQKHRTRVLAALLALVAGSACADTDRTQVSEVPPADFSTVADGPAVEEFVDSVRALDNDNEILVYFKDAQVPPIDRQVLAGKASGAVAVFPAAPGRGRKSLGFASSGSAPRTGILELLETFGLQPYSVGRTLPFAAVRVPDERLREVVSALVAHPNTDFVEANRAHELTVAGSPALPASVLAAPPLGSNPIDNKHTFHRVDDAWDFTRGDGVEIGLIDSGFTSDGGSGWHPDGGDILVRGTVDDYGNCGGYDPSMGTCEKRDDFYAIVDGVELVAHGTHVVGLVGESDNSIDRVGVAPLADVYSLKAIQNCGNTGCGSQYYTIEDDDWEAAIDFAVSEGLAVLSMSFVADISYGIWLALDDAYHNHDILLLAGTGNTPDKCDLELVRQSFVTGVGGVDDAGANFGCDDHQEVSALADGPDRGYSTDASCGPTGFCVADAVDQVGGTSAATAITAGIAGLVRAHFGGWSASQVRNRLIAKSDGPHDVVNAYRAIVGDEPNVTITGPDQPPENSTETWYAGVSEGMAPFTYAWYRNDALVSSSSSYTGNTGSTWFELRVDVVDDIGRSDADTMVVVPCSGSQCVQ